MMKVERVLLRCLGICGIAFRKTCKVRGQLFTTSSKVAAAILEGGVIIEEAGHNAGSSGQLECWPSQRDSAHTAVHAPHTLHLQQMHNRHIS